MERRDFLIKLMRSILIVTTVVVTGFALSKNTNAEATECPPDANCAGCQKLNQCGLAKNKLSGSKNTMASQDTQIGPDIGDSTYINARASTNQIAP